MRKKRGCLILSLCTLLFASCAKEGPTGPTGPAGPVFYGTVTGYVSMYDKYGSRVLNRLRHVSVTLSNSSVAAIPDSTTGSFSFSNVSTGTYTLAATADSGYAATNRYNVNFVSDKLTQDIKLSAIPDSFITSFTANLNSAALSDSLTFTFTADTRARKCIVFLGASNVSNNPALYLTSYIINIPANTTALTYSIPQQDLRDAGLASGATVYCAAYSYVVGDVSVFEDQATGKSTYYAVNATPIIQSVVVP